MNPTPAAAGTLASPIAKSLAQKTYATAVHVPLMYCVVVMREPGTSMDYTAAQLYNPWVLVVMRETVCCITTANLKIFCS